MGSGSGSISGVGVTSLGIEGFDMIRAISMSISSVMVIFGFCDFDSFFKAVSISFSPRIVAFLGFKVDLLGFNEVVFFDDM